VSCRGLDDPRDFADVFNGVFKQDESHEGVIVIILFEGLCDMVLQLLIRHQIVTPVSGNARDEVAEYQVLGVARLEVALEVKFAETLFQEVEHQLLVLEQVI